MRDRCVIGNWKMNILPSSTRDFVNNLVEKLNGKKAVICVPFVDLGIAVETSLNTNLKIGAQNMYFKDSGAFTGEVSADMLNDIGVEYVIVGHSERRQYFFETDEDINMKIKVAHSKNLKPIFCVGETLKERESNTTFEVLERQLNIGLEGLRKNDVINTIVAYEPVWAIGTGITATPEDAEVACKFIRNVIEKKYGLDVSDEVIIQYGGSVKPSNASELFSMPNIDGGLIGGASLNVEDFINIVNA